MIIRRKDGPIDDLAVATMMLSAENDLISTRQKYVQVSNMYFIPSAQAGKEDPATQRSARLPNSSATAGVATPPDRLLP